MEKINEIQLPNIPKETGFINESFSNITNIGFAVVEMQYSVLGMKNAEPDCYVRNGVAERLYLASTLLPDNLHLKIYDGWRSLALQEELYTTYKQKIINDFDLQGLSFEEQNKIIAKYVSLPKWDDITPPVHTTGGAVDVTLVDDNGAELPMGTEFDAFSEMTGTAYFEKNGADTEIRNNRRLLYHVMTKAGFTNLPSEWWHYDFGDWFWAFYSNKPVLYNGISKSSLFLGRDFQRCPIVRI